MKLLLDTHAFIWWVSAPEKLSDELSHVLALSNLPPHHKDPFDRLLVAQAGAEDAFLVSADGVFSRYAVRLLW